MVKKTKCFLGKMKNKRSMFPLITCYSTLYRGLASKTHQGKEIKVILIGKEVKLSLCADGLVVYVENLIRFMRKVLNLKSGFSLRTKKAVTITVSLFMH